MGGGNEMPERCPRCGEAVIPGAKLTSVPQPDGYTPVWHLTHKRASGKGCGAYLGVPLGHEQTGSEGAEAPSPGTSAACRVAGSYSSYT